MNINPPKKAVRDVLASEGEYSNKILRSKSKHAMIQFKKAKEMRQKEAGWNERHHVQIISRYINNPDPYSNHIKPKLKERERENGKGRRKNQASIEKPTENKHNRKHNVDELYKDAIKNSLLELQLSYEKSEIPPFHAETVLQLIPKISDYQLALDKIKVQHQDIKKSQSSVQLALDDVNARQNCLKMLKELTVQIPPNLPVITEKLNHLRKINISVIESISNWKKYIESFSPNKKVSPIFKFEGSNYLLKLREDTHFLYALPYAKSLGLTGKIQPFIGFSGISKSLTKRLKTCEQILDEQRYLQDVAERGRQAVHLSPAKPAKQKQIKGKRKQFQQIIKKREQEQNQSKPQRFMINQEKFTDWYNDMKAGTNSSISNAFGQVSLSNYVQIGIIRLKHNYCLLGIDKNYQKRRVVMLNVMGRIQISGLKDFLAQIIQYIWEQDSAFQIKVNLYHEKTDETYAINKLIEQSFKENGFMWRMTNNDRITGLKVNSMSLRRPPNFVSQPQAHLQIQSVMLLRKGTENARQLKKWLWSSVNQISLKRMASKKDWPVNQQDKLVLSRIGELAFEGIRTFQFQNENGLVNVARDHMVRLGAISSFSEPCVCSIMSLSFKWINYSYGQRVQDDRSRRFVRFEPNSERPIVEASSSLIKAPIYIIPTDEDGCSFLVFEAGEIKSLEQAEEVVSKLLEQQKELQQQLWMPLFSKMGISMSNGIQQHCLISTQFKSSLYSLKAKQQGRVLKGSLIVGMLSQQALQKCEKTLWLGWVDERDYI